jgi:Rrf2 family protein
VYRLKLSTRARYGTRALLDLAIHREEKPVQLKNIADRQQISPLYLEQLISPLLAAGILRSTRGAKGGIWLARSPGEVKLSEVIQLLEGSILPVECINDPDICPHSTDCVTRQIWEEMGKAMNGVLESTTLQDLVEREKAKEQSDKTMYYI